MRLIWKLSSAVEVLFSGGEGVVFAGGEFVTFAG